MFDSERLALRPGENSLRGTAMSGQPTGKIIYLGDAREEVYLYGWTG